MPEQSAARRVQWFQYDGENGAALVAAIEGASINSGGTGESTLVIDISGGGGQHQLYPDQVITWTEYPNATPQVLDIFSVASHQIVYGPLGDDLALVAQIEALEGAVAGLSGLVVQSISGSTDSNGSVTLTWPEEFSEAPVVTLALETGTSQIHSARITSNSSTATVVHVLRAPQVTVLGIDVLGATVNAASVTVHAVGLAPIA